MKRQRDIVNRLLGVGVGVGVGVYVIVIIILLLSIIILRCNTIVENFYFLTNPQIEDGEKIYIKTQDGKYWTLNRCVNKDANLKNLCKTMISLTDDPYLSSQFTFHKYNDGTFSLETYSGLYLKRCAGCVHNCPHAICGDGINPNLQTHKFVLIKNRDDSISIKTDNGRLLDVTECDQSCGKVITAIGLTESSRFLVEKIPQLPKKSPFSAAVMSKLEASLPHDFPRQWPFSDGQ